MLQYPNTFEKLSINFVSQVHLRGTNFPSPVHRRATPLTTPRSLDRSTPLSRPTHSRRSSTGRRRADSLSAAPSGRKYYGRTRKKKEESNPLPQTAAALPRAAGEKRGATPRRDGAGNPSARPKRSWQRPPRGAGLAI